METTVKNAPGKSLEAIARDWKALHDQAAQVGELADLMPEDFAEEMAQFSHRLGDAKSWQVEMAQQGIEDIDAMMQPGLTALRTITTRGQSATAPALALWREFHAARQSVLKLLDSPGA